MSIPFTEVIDALAPVTATLDSLSIAYLVCGSTASIIHGIPRYTQDVDLVAELTYQAADPFAAALRTQFYLDAGGIREAIRLRRSFNLIHLKTFVKIDIFVAKDDPFTRIQIERRARQELPGGSGKSAVVASAEDTILSKLRWYRDGGGVSDQQWKDILGVLKVQGDRLDRVYLLRWSGELGLADLLSRAADDAGFELYP